VHEPDLGDIGLPFAQRLARGGLRALVMAPLIVEGSVIGVLAGARRAPHSFSSGDCEFLRQLSEHVALATHQAQLHSALQRAYDELRQSQQAAMQQERLRALGQMASGIAHDINNAISPVALYTEHLLERESGLTARGRQALATIARSIDDVAATVARMRDFLMTVQAMLEADGHLVVAANAGQDSIDIFRAELGRGAHVSVVLTDLGMPYVDGRKVARAVKELSPSTPVILLTGWGQGLNADADGPEHVDEVLSKPPKLRDLRQALLRHGGGDGVVRSIV
jgi:CheY-like chemotaxis protein